VIPIGGGNPLVVLISASPPDTNWFYSTVAQSTAAIVGLAGGFLAARLVSHRGLIASERTLPRNQFLGLQNAISEYHARADAFLNGLRAIIQEGDTQIEAGTIGTVPLPLTEIGSLRDSYTSPGNPPITEGQLEQLKEAEAVAERFAASLSVIDDSKKLARTLLERRLPIPEEFDTRGAIPTVAADWWAELEVQAAYAGLMWWDIRVRFADVSELLESLRSQLVPRSMLVLLCLLAALLVVGAVVPMGYLSAQGGSSKTYLLAAFGVLSVGVVVVLAYEMMRIRLAAELDRATF
jgi:hypothetical protein